MKNQDDKPQLKIQVRDEEENCRPIAGAAVSVCDWETKDEVWRGKTGADGSTSTDLRPGSYQIKVSAFGIPRESAEVEIPDVQDVTVKIPIGFSLKLSPVGVADWQSEVELKEGSAIQACLTWRIANSRDLPTSLTTTIGSVLTDYQQEELEGEVKRYYYVDLRGARGMAKLQATLKDGLRSSAGKITDEATAAVRPDSQSITGDVNVSMRRTATEVTEDIGLWVVIRKSAEALSFKNYFRFVNHVLCGEPIGEPRDFETERFPAKQDRFDQLRQQRFLPFTDAEAYRFLKVATEAFVVVNCGVALSNFQFKASDLDYVIRRVGKPVDLGPLWTSYLTAVNGTSSLTLPYLALIRDKLRDVQLKSTVFPGVDGGLPAECFGILRDKLTNPCLLELIWSYWHEEGMLVQSVNAIMRRFQNVRGPQDSDPLANLEIDPLRPLNSLLLGLYPGRAAPAERRSPQLRVRPSLRSARWKVERSLTCVPPIRARSSSRPSTTCFNCAPASSSRTTTRR